MLDSPHSNFPRITRRNLYGPVSLLHRPRLFAILGSLIVLLGVSMVLGSATLDRVYRERALPNVTISGVAVGQMTPAEARLVLEQQSAAFLETPVTLVYDGRTWQPTAAQLGVALALDDALEQVYSLGNTSNPLARLLRLLALQRNGYTVPLHLTIDQPKLQAYLLTLAAGIDAPMQDASLSVANGRILMTPAQVGRQLLVDATAQEVLASLQTLHPQTVPLRTRLLEPALGDDGIAAAQQQLSDLLQGPLTLTANGERWVWSRADLGTLAQVTREPRTDGPGEHLTVTLDRATLEQWLAAIAAEIDVDPVEPRVRFNGGALQITQKGSNGQQLEQAEALAQIMTAMQSDQRTLALPVAVAQPQARPDTLASLGIGELVAQGQSSFANSAPYRITNIQAGARQMDGVLIAPGEEFSFNQTVGDINAANGFTQGYAIINGRTQLEWGGGVCQVSTTVFRAAFWAGVPITERNQHTYRILWYEKFEPVGMDAAIFTGPGGYDVRFVNDTGNWLLMESYADVSNAVLTINLYGTHPGWDVSQVPPSIAPAGAGIEVWVGRVVTDAAGTTRSEDTFYSFFPPWPAGS